ncbi:MAG: radical SAM protein [Tannerellaceae bacterium]|nr:radical SAM protein [Tannerellaceae bacterium]
METVTRKLYYRNLNSKGLYVYPCDKLISLPEDTLRLLYSPMARKGMWIEQATAIALEMEQPVSKDIQKAVDELRDFTPLKEQADKVKEVKDYPLLTVLLNQTCNLACSYCYSAKGRSNDKLSLDKLKNTIDYFIEKKENNNKPLSISYMGGGEPLLSWDLIKESVPYAKEQAGKNNQQIDFTIITNGTIMQDKMIEFIREHTINISISFEIIKEVQNRQRGMYYQVVKTIHKLIDNGIIPQINSTITPANVGRMVEMYEILDKDYPQITNMMFEPVTSAGLFKKKEKLEQFLKEYTENFLTIDTEARKQGKSLTSFPYLRTVYPTERACPGEFCVTPTGEITGCYCISSPRDPGYNQSIYGRVAEYVDTEEKITIKNGKFKELVHNDNVYTRKKCEDCVVKWNCGGGCFYLRNCYSEEYQEVFCDFTRDFVQKIVLSRYKRLYEKQCGVAPADNRKQIKTNAVVLNQG